MSSMISADAHVCPMCGGLGYPDDIPPVEIGGLLFKSMACDRYGALPGSGEETSNTMPGHLFPGRWLESEAADGEDLEHFTKAFAYVRPPFQSGTALAEAFGDTDARLAWVQHSEPVPGGRVRVLIRL